MVSSRGLSWPQEKEVVTEWLDLSKQTKSKLSVKKTKTGQILLGFARNTEQERAFAKDWLGITKV